MTDHGTILVADVGGTSMKLSAVLDGAPAPFSQRVSSHELRCADPLGAFETIFQTFAKNHALAFDAVVMTVPGFVDRDFDRVLYAANLPELNGVSLSSGLSKRLGVPVTLERDAVLLLQGERASGVAQGTDSVLGIFFGTGVGAALIENDQVFRGAGWALEIGHMPIHGDAEPLDGLKADSLEVYASGRRLNQLAETYGVPVEALFEQEGPPALLDDLETFVRDQAFATASSLLMFCPETLVLGGGVLDMRGYPREALVEQVRARATLPPKRPLDIRFATRGWRAVLDAAQALMAEREASFQHAALHAHA
ncbi:ROK family protein [Ahrensia marina]|uniref:ROK family protein n=1 Tax=Ahrensia marina TaxID=1514904 RepID=UPI0035CF036B